MHISDMKPVLIHVWFPGSRNQTSLVERDFCCSLLVQLTDEYLQEILLIILIELDSMGLLITRVKLKSEVIKRPQTIGLDLFMNMPIRSKYPYTDISRFALCC